MNKTNGVRDQAGGSTSLYCKEHIGTQNNRQSTLAIPSFLRWFKRNERDYRKSAQNLNNITEKEQTLDSSLSLQANHLSSNYNSHETLSPPSSPILGYLSPSSSCDSVFSTSTTGFAFIKPNNYKPYGNAEVPEPLIASGPETETYRRRLKDQQNSRETDKRLELTLRKKYCLYDDDTITSSNNLNIDSGYDNVKFFDRSLPHIRNKGTITIEEDDYETRASNVCLDVNNRRRHRRATSDNSKDKKSGAYVHVKGKRKAPDPPALALNGSVGKSDDDYSYEIYQRSNSSNYSCRNISGTLSPGSTLGRKKRRAPQPPTFNRSSSSKSPLDETTKSILSDGLLDDKEIKAIIEGTSSARSSYYLDIDIMKGTPNKREQTPPEYNAARKLTEEQKQILIDNVVKSQTGSINNLAMSENETDKNEVPISPRPWYKRPISTNRDSSIPFKREIVLKTMEKRKGKSKEKETKSNSGGSHISETHSRSSIFDATHKFGFFMRGKDNNDKDKEKRRSAIGIPNISELDREAAAIVSKENANAKAKQRAEDEKFYSHPEHLVLQQQMFGSRGNVGQMQTDDVQNDPEQSTTTKDLISKFEATSNTSRITLNTSFIGRKDNFFDGKAQDKQLMNNDVVEDVFETKKPNTGENETKVTGIFSKNDTSGSNVRDQKPKSNGNNQSVSDLMTNITKPEDGNNITQMSWTCPYCTLENPNWRIICEVCERIKPYDKKGNVGEKVLNTKTNLIAKKSEAPKPPITKTDEPIETNQNDEKIINKMESNKDWDKKTEKVMKYFGNALSKSSSETTVVGTKQLLFRKSPSPSKLLGGSPKLGLRSSKLEQPDLIKSQVFNKSLDQTEMNILSLGKKRPLIDSSAIVTTITPVFYATTTVFQQEETVPNNPANQKIGESIDLTEVRNARLAKFSPNLPLPPLTSSSPKLSLSSTKLEDLSDHDSLEREKKRLREMIRAMNAKALAEKYPALQNNPSEIHVTDQAEGRSKKDINRTEANKLGAIKKVFARNRSPDVVKRTNMQPIQLQSLEEETLDENSDYFSRPKKVSSSAQTAGLVKKPEIDESARTKANDIKTYELIAPREFTERKTAKINSNIYANVPSPTNPQIMGDGLNCFGIKDNISNYYSNQYTKFSEYDKAKVQEISQQLKSVEGINDFKATLVNPTKGLSRTDTLALNKIMRNLETAIAEGQDELAAKIAVDLAKMKVSLHVTKQKNRPLSNEEFDRNIIVDMYVEDKVSHKGPIQISIRPFLTIAELKDKIFKDFEIPAGVQRWLINDELAMDDSKTLLQCGVKDNMATFYLYLVAPEIKAQETKAINSMQNNLPLTSKAIPEDLDENDRYSSDSHNGLDNDNDNEDVISHEGAVALPTPNSQNTKVSNVISDSSSKTTGWSCPLCTLINHPELLACSACTKARPLAYVQPPRTNRSITNTNEGDLKNSNKVALSDELKRFLGGEKVQYRPAERKNDLNKSNPNRKSSDIFNIVIKSDQNASPIGEPLPSSTADQHKASAGNFSSPNITKSKYRGVDNFNPNRLKDASGHSTDDGGESTDNEKYHQETLKTNRFEFQTSKHYLELLNLDNSDIVPNVDLFECPICFLRITPGHGVTLRDCLHTFCKECLINTIQYSEEAQVKCPYMDNDYSCEIFLQDREVKAIVSKDIYEMHLAKSVRVAECQIENTFHCKTPNCRGWCIYEDNVNQFKCPVCRITNCLTCRVIHDGLTCKQYQDRLNSDCDSNLEARRTREMLNEMVEKGEAMNCPTCQVIMMKKWGCDWLKCSMCKTEVCWVTRGPRWGPGGKGDTSAGCKCGVDGKKCHPKCNYCH